MLEYIIIVVVVAVSALVVMGAFSDRLRTMVAGATASLGGEPPEITSSLEDMRNLTDEGLTD
jgi:hypothetical protein